MSAENVYPAFCIHFDHHPHPDFTPHYDHGLTLDGAVSFLEAARPDAVQVHAIGTHGYTSYPSSIGTKAESVKGDPIAVWKTACEKTGVRLGLYLSPFGGGRLLGTYPVINREGKSLANYVCANQPYFEEFLEPLIHELVDRYDPGQLWMDGTQGPWNHRDECVCPACKARYREIYGEPMPMSPEGQEWIDVERFTQWTHNHFITRIAESIHNKKPTLTVCFNFTGCFPDARDITKEADWLSADCLNEGDLHRATLQAGFLASHRRKCDIMLYEKCCVSTPTGMKAAPRPMAQLKTETSIILAHGHRLNFWQDPEADGSLAPARGRIAGEMETFVRQRQDWCIDNQSVAEIAVLFPHEGHIDELRVRNRAAENLYQLLQEAHLPADFLFQHATLSRVRQYRLIIIPEISFIPQPMLDHLRQFLDEGGCVLFAPGQHMTDSSNWLARITGGECSASAAATDAGFVCFDDDVFPLGRKRYDLGGNWQCINPYHPVDGHFIMVPNQDHTVTRTLVPVPTPGTPWLADRQVGQGRLLCITSEIFNDYADRHHPGLRNRIAEIIRDALDHRPLTELNGHPGIEIVQNRQKNDLLIHCVNVTAGTTCNHRPSVYFDEVPLITDLALTVRPPAAFSSIRLLPDDRELSTDCDEDGTIHLKIPSFRHHCAIRLLDVYS